MLGNVLDEWKYLEPLDGIMVPASGIILQRMGGFLPDFSNSTSCVNIEAMPHRDPHADLLSSGGNLRHPPFAEKKPCGCENSLRISVPIFKFLYIAFGSSWCGVTVNLNRMNELLRIRAHLALAVDSLRLSPAFSRCVSTGLTRIFFSPLQFRSRDQWRLHLDIWEHILPRGDQRSASPAICRLLGEWICRTDQANLAVPSLTSLLVWSASCRRCIRLEFVTNCDRSSMCSSQTDSGITYGPAQTTDVWPKSSSRGNPPKCWRHNQ